MTGKEWLSERCSWPVCPREGSQDAPATSSVSVKDRNLRRSDRAAAAAAAASIYTPYNDGRVCLLCFYDPLRCCLSLRSICRLGCHGVSRGTRGSSVHERRGRGQEDEVGSGAEFGQHQEPRRAAGRTGRHRLPHRILGEARPRHQHPGDGQEPGGEALLGCGAGPPEADPHEPVHHVHVRKHHLHLPHHDGVHDGLETHPGAHVHVCHLQAAGELEPTVAAGSGVPGGKPAGIGARHLQVPVHGVAAHALV